MARGLAIILVSSLLVGCSNLDERTFKGLSTTDASSRLGAAIWVAPVCPSKGGDKELAIAAPLIAAGVSFAASYAVKAVERSIEEYKKGLSGSFGASGLGEDVGKIKCLIIARGLLGEVSKVAVDPKDKLTEIYPKLGFQEYPVFYLELENQSRAPESSVSLQPVYLSYSDSIARNFGSGRKHVTAAIAFSLTSPKVAEEANPGNSFAVFHHDFGRLEIGKRYVEGKLIGTAASAQFDGDKLGKKFNISAVISDAEDAGVAFQVLSDAFLGKKTDIEKALEETIKKAVYQGKEPKN